MLKPICYACAADLCLCGLAVVAGEAHEFGRPSQLLCENAPAARDLGPPERCNSETAPHGRRFFVNSITVASSTSSTYVGLATVVDIEDAAERVDQRFAFSALPMSGGAPPVCNIANRVTLFVVHDGKVPEQMW